MFTEGVIMQKILVLENDESALKDLREFIENHENIKILELGTDKKEKQNFDIGLNKLPISKDGSVYFINYEDILYINVKARELNIITYNANHICEESLTYIEKKLKGNTFMRCHRSYIVNLTKVNKITHWVNGIYLLELEGVEEKVPVSRSYYKDLKLILEI